MNRLDKPITNLSDPIATLDDTNLTFDRGQSTTPKGRRIVTDGMSHVAGSEETPLLECTIPEMLAETVRNYGARDAVVFSRQQIRWSWKKFSDEVDALAAGFLSLGLKTGDRLGIWSPNRPEWLLTQFATARIGVILVTINPAYRVAELEHTLNLSGCTALVMAQQFKSSDYVQIFNELAAGDDSGDPVKRNIEKLPNLKIVVCMKDSSTESAPDGMMSFDDVASLAGPAQRARLDSVTSTLTPEDAINIQFTSGTTGLPKGAVLSHRNIVNNAQFTVGAMNFTHRDRLCIPVPLYHCFGMVMGTLGCVTKGAVMVFPGEGFDPTETIQAIASESCTALYGVPTMFNAILSLNDFSKFNLSSLRTGIMAGAPCPIETMNQVVNDMHMGEVTIAYGMTETSPVSFQSNVDDPIQKRVSTIGRVHPHVECCVIDEAGSIVPTGEIGELCTRGYSIMKGYWNDEKRTKEAIDEDGWMHTGDLAVFDDEGFCNIVGRSKDVIIRGGENVYPKEIEDYIYLSSKVQDVQVFGVPDSKFGEQVCAWVVPKPGESLTESEIIDFCEGQIAHYKVPKHVRIKEELPMTVSGKAQKFKMRSDMVKELNLDEIETA